MSIMAAVAVLLMNMEKIPVMRMKPSSTISLRLPNGRSRCRARKTSSPEFRAAMARMNPPRKRMMTGLAKVAMISLELISDPNTSPSPLKNGRLLFEMLRHMVVIMASEVAHDGIHSVTQASVANTSRAITRCCTTVSPWMSKTAEGRFHTTAVIRMMMIKAMSFFGRTGCCPHPGAWVCVDIGMMVFGFGLLLPQI